MITAKKFKVFSLGERRGERGMMKTTFTRIGVGFVNRDNSINLYLDASSLSGKLQLRDYDEPDRRELRDGASAGASGERADADGASAVAEAAALASAQLGAHTGGVREDVPF